MDSSQDIFEKNKISESVYLSKPQNKDIRKEKKNDNQSDSMFKILEKSRNIHSDPKIQLNQYNKRPAEVEKRWYKLDVFLKQNQIGTDSFGKVYKVKHKKTGEIYAAKISQQAFEESNNNIISKLNHPAILKFICFSPLNFKRKPKPVIITAV